MSPPPAKRKRKVLVDDEIDTVFRTSLGKSVKRTVLDSATAAKTESGKPLNIKGSHDLRDVLTAIRVAPKEAHEKRKSK